MQKSLFVAGLDFSMTSEDLKTLFANHGLVESAKIVTDFNTGRSKGFGFVDMATSEDAQKCIDALNNTTVHNRQIVVRVKEDRPAGGSGGGRSNGGGGGGYRGGNSGGGQNRSW